MEKKRILVIDDEESFTEMLKVSLEETGKYEVRGENKGSRGLAATKEFKPDLILLDQLMPDMLGHEVLFQIESDQELKDTPVVFLTAVVPKSEENVERDHPFIAKPVSLDKLIACIEENLRE